MEVPRGLDTGIIVKLFVAAKVDLEWSRMSFSDFPVTARAAWGQEWPDFADGPRFSRRSGLSPRATLSPSADRAKGGREVRCRVEIPTLQEGGNSPKVTFWALLGGEKESTMVEHRGEPGRPGGPPPAARGRSRQSHGTPSARRA